jgi:hypothetical protein
LFSLLFSCLVSPLGSIFPIEQLQHLNNATAVVPFRWELSAAAKRYAAKASEDDM